MVADFRIYSPRGRAFVLAPADAVAPEAPAAAPIQVPFDDVLDVPLEVELCGALPEPADARRPVARGSAPMPIVVVAEPTEPEPAPVPVDVAATALLAILADDRGGGSMREQFARKEQAMCVVFEGLDSRTAYALERRLLAEDRDDVAAQTFLRLVPERRRRLLAVLAAVARREVRGRTRRAAGAR